MGLTICCPHCSARLKVSAPDGAAPLQCPKCQSRFARPGHAASGSASATLPPADLAVLRAGAPAAAAPDRPVLPGYEVLEPLGRGGMGEVYKARHLRLDRLVALKVIRADLLLDADAVRRFQREARAAAKLAHPNIVTVHDAAEFGGKHFLVMEYVEGTDLRQRVKVGGPLPVAQACAYVRQAALGLQHAHERGLVHRDIKPGNLLVTSEGQVKLLDMGLALLLPQNSVRGQIGRLTRDGDLLGTPDYLAPEQAVDSRQVDARADLYSLGCTLYFLLTGRVPFPADSLVEVLVKHRDSQPEPLSKLRPDLPAALEPVVARMLAKRPADRYQSGAEVARALEPFTRPAGSGSSTRPLRLWSHPRVRFSRRGWFLAGAGTLALVMALFLGGRRWGSSPGLENDAREPGAPANTDAEARADAARQVMAGRKDNLPPAPRVTPAPVPDGDGWVDLLADGLDGWKIVGVSNWSFDDGILVSEGKKGKEAKGGSCLMSAREYADFELTLDFKMPPGRGVHVFLRAAPNEASGRKVLQVIFGNDERKGSVRNQPGALLALLRPGEASPEVWNTGHIRAVGPRVQVSLNGTLLQDVNLDVLLAETKQIDKLTRTQGHLGLKSAVQSDTEYRNVRIRELDAGPPPAGKTTPPASP